MHLNELTKYNDIVIQCHDNPDADALASAVSVLGPEKGLALIRTLPQTEAQILHLTEDGKVEKFGKE